MTATIHHSFNLVCYWGVDRTNTAWRPSLTCARTSAHTHRKERSCFFTRDHAPHACSYDPLWKTVHPQQLIFVTNTYTHRYTVMRTSSFVQESDLLCGWLWPLAQGPSPWMYHQSFKAIKHFSMRIACSSLSKTERSDSQSHFLPNPIKGGKGRGGENEVEDLKWRAFI